MDAPNPNGCAVDDNRIWIAVDRRNLAAVIDAANDILSNDPTNDWLKGAIEEFETAYKQSANQPQGEVNENTETDTQNI